MKNENSERNIEEITKEFEKKLREGLSKNQITVTDISMMITDSLESIKDSLVETASEIIKDEEKDLSEEQCPDCGRDLKKTKK